MRYNKNMALTKRIKNPLVTPVVKWVGGKRQLLDEILPAFPKRFGTYFEPFFGGGAVLFARQPKKALINDLNADLIRVYIAIRDNPEELIRELKKFENTKECFYAQRELDRDKSSFNKLTDIQKAARLIYLNKTCYNGLYRVNSAGEFNTPFGAYKNPNIVNEVTIMAIHSYLTKNEITIAQGDFSAAVERAQKGDFVYFDPPYDPVSTSAAFTGYNEGGFDKKEQIRLRDLCLSLVKKGVYVMVSNSATEFIKELYSDPCFRIKIVKAKRSINSDGAKRGEVDEVLITSYE